MDPLRLLFVCTGNTCRSSLAEAIMKKILADRTAADYSEADSGESSLTVEVSSAGTSAFAGDEASPHAIEVAREQGIDLTGHRSRRLTHHLLETVDLVLTMTQSHKRAVLAMAPAMEGRVFTLKEAAWLSGSDPDGLGLDISDPFGGDLGTYRRTAGEIEKNLRWLMPRLKDWKPQGRNQSR